MMSEGFPPVGHWDDVMIVGVRRGKPNHPAPNLTTRRFSDWLQNHYRTASVVEQQMLSHRLHPQSRGTVEGGFEH